MFSSRPSVLLLQPIKFQAQVWKTVLQSQHIGVLEEPNDISLPQLASQREALEQANISLLLVDLGTPHLNAFEVCQWYHQNYPDTKLILTAGLRNKVLANERLLALEQGAEDFFPGFQQDHLLPAALTRVKRVLEILQYHPLEEKVLINDLMTFYHNGVVPAHKLPTPSQLVSFSNVPTQSHPSDNGSQSSTIILSDQAYSLERIAVAEDDLLLPISEEESPLPVQSPHSRNLGLSRMYLRASFVMLLLLIAGFWGWLRWPRQLQVSSNQGDAELPLMAKAKKDAAVSAVSAGLYRYGGSATWALIRPSMETAIASTYPGLQLRYTEVTSGTPGSGPGITMLLDGKLDFTQSTRPLKDQEYALAQQRGFQLRQHAIGMDGVAIVVHPSLAIPGLTVDQLRQIYLGEIQNWNQVGGPNQAIIPFSRYPQDAGTVDYFQEYVLQNQSFGSSVVSVYSTTDALRQLKSTPGGIYYASAAEVLYQCTAKPLPLGLSAQQMIPPQMGLAISSTDCPLLRNQPNLKAFRDGSYPLTRSLFVIVKENQSREQFIGEAYTKLMLSDQGQKILEQAGFVRLES